MSFDPMAGVLDDHDRNVQWPPPFRAESWEVREVEHAQAVAFIEELHYAQGAPNTSVARHGLFRIGGAEIQGVALWLPPTRNAAASVNPANPGGVLSLSRFCLRDDVPRNGESFLLGRAMRRLDRRRWPTLLTYADSRHGHVGTIYRATNWEYLGEVAGADNWVDGEGVQRGRKRGGKNLTAREMRDLGFVRLPALPKHKFVHHAT